MPRCKVCGAEGLEWGKEIALGNWRLYEPDSQIHKCKIEDQLKEQKRLLGETLETKEAVRRYKEINGYL